ncbi:hypothetical protein KPA97_24390, partial [Burkholderia cenocepacia]|nr:hypothetical protein [Burkholderia cenocepacia]
MSSEHARIGEDRAARFVRERIRAGQRRKRGRVAFERGIARVIVGKTAAEAQRAERRAVGRREIARERREQFGQHERVGLRRVLADERMRAGEYVQPG